MVTFCVLVVRRPARSVTVHAISETPSGNTKLRVLTLTLIGVASVLPLIFTSCALVCSDALGVQSLTTGAGKMTCCGSGKHVLTLTSVTATDGGRVSRTTTFKLSLASNIHRRRAA